MDEFVVTADERNFTFFGSADTTHQEEPSYFGDDVHKAIIKINQLFTGDNAQSVPDIELQNCAHDSIRRGTLNLFYLRWLHIFHQTEVKIEYLIS